MSQNFKKISILAALAVLVAGAAAAGARYDREVVETFEFDVSDGGKLSVDVPDADIVLETGSSGRMTIEMEISGRNLEDARERYEGMDFRASSDRGGVSLRSDRSRGVWGGGSWGHFNVVARIRLPERFDVDLETNDGDVSIEAIDGRLTVKTSDGDVAIGRADTRGEVRIVSSDGDIAIGALVGDEVTVSTSDGDIAVANMDTRGLTLRSSDGDIAAGSISGPLTATTSDGDIEVDIDEFAETTLKSGDGDIEIRLDASAGADIDLSGDEVSFRRTSVSFDGEVRESSARGRLNGGGPPLTASSRDGEVTLRLR